MKGVIVLEIDWDDQKEMLATVAAQVVKVPDPRVVGVTLAIREDAEKVMAVFRDEGWSVQVHDGT